MPDASLTELLIDQGYYGQKEELLRSWSAIDTHARLEADFEAGGPWPVLLFSHGMGLSRVNYTALAVELASQGYAVATLDHPRGGITVLGDGAVLSTEDDPEFEARWEERGLEWVDDFRFALEELAKRFPEELDLGRVGAIGPHGRRRCWPQDAAWSASPPRGPRRAPFSLTEREGLPADAVREEQAGLLGRGWRQGTPAQRRPARAPGSVTARERRPVCTPDSRAGARGPAVRPSSCRTRSRLAAASSPSNAPIACCARCCLLLRRTCAARGEGLLALDQAGARALPARTAAAELPPGATRYRVPMIPDTLLEIHEATARDGRLGRPGLVQEGGSGGWDGNTEDRVPSGW